MFKANNKKNRTKNKIQKQDSLVLKSNSFYYYFKLMFAVYFFTK